MFILLKSATSGDKQTWNISLSTNANQNKIGERKLVKTNNAKSSKNHVI